VIYSKTITAAAGGSAAFPIDADLPVTNGLIYQFELYFPPGSSGLLSVRVADGGFPVWPSEPGEWFYGDNTLIAFPDRYYIASPDHKFKVWYYNLDDTYPHKFTIRIGQVTAAAFISSFIPSYGQTSIEDVLKALAEQQASEKEARVAKIGDYFTPVSESMIEEGSD